MLLSSFLYAFLTQSEGFLMVFVDFAYCKETPFGNPGNELRELWVAVGKKPAQGDCRYSRDMHFFMQLTTPRLLFVTDTALVFKNHI